ncbi:S41 family peptidase [Gracilinema caldarium]|uniref:Carboxyl-terminal protease n=1 Tax=Gracilinema caldarium (strain ATCC 51460 / DSM 7334 / H1) TaxID=744872 RepID=F8EYH5_GRAC1|nr:S41 family peptidase [Gracilinema caldarium]AEJ18407.1 carboxyl-terminal protease [Gracilinema caldarium DSM 7334]
MNEPNSITPKRKGFHSRIWIGSTLIFSLLFVFVAVSDIQAQNKNTAAQNYPSIIQNVYDFILRHYVDEVDPKTLYEGAMKGMFEALNDPYSTFLTEADMSDLNDTTQGSFGGVGLYISKPTGPKPDGQPPYVEVAAPIEDTPGWRAGIQPGDLIIEINGENTEKLTMDQVLSKLRGVPGTEVTILIRRGDKLEFPVKLTRAIIEVPTVKHAMVGSDIGYVRIITFTPMTTERVHQAINEFKKNNYKAIIVDLRNNYGGLLSSAIGVSDLFLDGGVVVSTKSRLPDENAVFTARKNPLVPTSIPVVVLINRGSASASEIVAGAFKDRGRAYLIGERSFGKGSVQQVYPIDGSGFKLTMARYYTPSDVNIDKKGIPPDREIKIPDLTEKEAEALNKLINDNKIPAFVKAEPSANQERIDSFAKQLSTAYGLEVTLLKRLIRDERNRTSIAPVYDLEYDIQLQEAVKVLRQENVAELLKSAKTLKQLQDESTAKEAAETLKKP